MLRVMTPDVPDEARIVAAGYDALGARYLEWAGSIADDSRDRWLHRLTAGLADGARVLDLGCGPGVPTARDLARRFAVTGVDSSAVQIAAARTAVPSAAFLVADMTAVAFEPGTFDAVVALYSMIHVRLADLPALLTGVRDWLRPGGLLLATFGTVEGEAIEADWLGVPMFFAGHAPAANRSLLAAAGFSIEVDAVIATAEPGHGEVAFHWVLARRGR